jgi:hypothetical protein
VIRYGGWLRQTTTAGRRRHLDETWPAGNFGPNQLQRRKSVLTGRTPVAGPTARAELTWRGLTDARHFVGFAAAGIIAAREEKVANFGGRPG